MKSRSKFILSTMIGVMVLTLLSPIPDVLSVEMRDKQHYQNATTADGQGNPTIAAEGLTSNGLGTEPSSQVKLNGAQLPDFRLIGTAVVQNSKLSIAIIDFGIDQGQRAYREGDPIGGIVLKKILNGKVIVGTNDGDAILVKGSGISLIAQTSITEPGRIQREKIEEAFPDYVSFMKAIRFRPFFDGGRPNGFVIYKIESGSVLDRMGIKNSDIIFSLNGEKFKTTQPVMEFYNAILDEPTISVEVIREEEIKELVIEIL